MGLTTTRQSAYWKIDYIATNFDTPHCHVRMLGWATKEDRDAGQPPIMATDFRFQGDNYLNDSALVGLEETIKQTVYSRIKAQQKWTEAQDVMESGQK